MQGHLDSLCGLYATLNALSVICAPVAPLTTKHHNALFLTGVAWHEQRVSLAAVLSYGMIYDLHIRLTKAFCAEVRARRGVDVLIDLPKGPTASLTLHRIQRFIDRALAEKAAVVVCLEHTLDHYSVIVGAGAGRYRLHDSIERKWITQDSVGPLRPHSSVRHQVKRMGMVSDKGIFARMMERMASEEAVPNAVMIGAIYFKTHRTVDQRGRLIDRTKAA